ncbi:hypothetical protein F5Y14DRAFT_65761 [Nemania sp. NC0429]|nr:hypothetical protein F5Y14DRAFT_65761 [Nemania sp. NC0429]
MACLYPSDLSGRLRAPGAFPYHNTGIHALSSLPLSLFLFSILLFFPLPCVNVGSSITYPLRILRDVLFVCGRILIRGPGSPSSECTGISGFRTSTHTDICDVVIYATEVSLCLPTYFIYVSLSMGERTGSRVL